MQRTIAIRVEPELHEQLTLLARLASRTLADEIREAIDTHIDRKRGEVDLTKQAEQALAEIDKAADERRKAIKSLLGSESPKTKRPAKPAGQ